jgi:3-isopropylmalate/(R)-2-methylmalate dehydratase large subunit
MYGALGAFAAGIGRTDMAGIWALGKTWLRVPETIRLNLKGKLEKGVEAKDVILYLIGKLGAGGATYKSIEFCGEIVKKFSMDARFVLSNMAVEAGAKAGIIEADKKTKEWLKEARGGKNKKYKVVESGIKSDADAEDYDLTSLEPQIALPHRVDNVKPISKIGKVHVDQAFLGTCTNGRLEDLETAAKIVRDEKVKIRFIICPASREVYLSAIKTGAIQDLLSAGATIIPPGCGPCVGNHGGIPGDYEVVVSSANRNFKGRMGNPNASIYLASSATVAASALTGRITDPRDFL